MLSLNTPGGAVDVTLKILDTMERYEGEILSFVDTEALSAGALIAGGTNAIYMAPKAVIGASAVIQSTGEDVPKTARLKMESFLQAKLRSVGGHHRYWAQVLRSMSDEDYEFAIEGVMIKPKGELLTLTADEAVRPYGHPPENLLAAAIVLNVEALMQLQLGEGVSFEIKHFELTWSEHLAQWISEMAPVILGLGMLLLFIEFKTPGFGFIGALGIACLMAVFLASYMAGLAGYEGVIVFLVGILLLVIELAFFPGVWLVAGTGLLCIVGALVWSMADVWPNQSPLATPEIFIGPLEDLVWGAIIAVVGIVALSRFLPKSWIWDRLVLSTQGVPGDALRGIREYAVRHAEHPLPAVGAKGVTLTDLFPSSYVTIDGAKYQARIA
ncbi:MAG TPA: ATP-dependent Clp protease proteolytic subunit, partial [Opitutales bacterium]|nr:ATP-dependent Clp protease proteolytic subunit [Opitutales bacterium]